MFSVCTDVLILLNHHNNNRKLKQANLKKIVTPQILVLTKQSRV